MTKEWFAVASSKRPPSKATPCVFQLSRQFLVAFNLDMCNSVVEPIHWRIPGRCNSLVITSMVDSGSRSVSVFEILRASSPHNWSILSCVCDFRRKRMPPIRIFLRAIRFDMYCSIYWFFNSLTVLSPSRMTEEGKRVPRFLQISHTCSRAWATISATVADPCGQDSSITFSSRL